MKRKKAIIIGINGQDGSYLAEFLIKKKYFVYGVTNRIKRNYHLKNTKRYLSLSLVKLLETFLKKKLYIC